MLGAALTLYFSLCQRLAINCSQLPFDVASGQTPKKGRTLWYLPVHEHGIALADRIDVALKKVASKLERESPDR